ncbi:hypothetical protein [Leptospira inadai]|uniref:hypothetical protein n=1 Tax=Leptospira inadai TaxID=29506 RepID=UPI001EE1C24E|nr:hypothetical protein [Leptospira inadai]
MGREGFASPSFGILPHSRRLVVMLARHPVSHCSLRVANALLYSNPILFVEKEIIGQGRIRLPFVRHPASLA